MAITRWDPFAELTTVERNIDRLWSRLMPPSAGADLSNVLWMPTTDILTHGEDMVVRAELPGVAPGDVDISVTDNVLTIRGHRAEETEDEKAGYMMRESFRGSFERSVTLPAGIDPATLKASFEHGVLEVTIPKGGALQETKTHHIPLAEGMEPGSK
jgi:HSP20 family protein